jgi:hypothetical protein
VRSAMTASNLALSRSLKDPDQAESPYLLWYGLMRYSLSFGVVEDAGYLSLPRYCRAIPTDIERARIIYDGLVEACDQIDMSRQ